MENEPKRVFRGGSWDSVAARVAYRFGSGPGFRYVFLGMRLVRLIAPLQQLAEVNND